MPSYFPQLHTSNSPPPFTLLSSLLNALPCFQPTFTRWTSGLCLGIFRGVNFVSPWYNNNNNECRAKGSGKEVKIQEFRYKDTTNVEP
jgi:hypothetical protein